MTASRQRLINPFNVFQFNVMPFGLASAPSTFKQLITIVILGRWHTACIADLDNIIVFSHNYIEKLSRLDTALKRVVQTNLKFKLSKYACKKL